MALGPDSQVHKRHQRHRGVMRWLTVDSDIPRLMVSRTLGAAGAVAGGGGAGLGLAKLNDGGFGVLGALIEQNG